MPITKKDRKRIDAVTSRILEQGRARDIADVYTGAVAPREEPLRSEDWKFAAGLAGAGLLSKAVPALGAEMSAFGPLYGNALKTLAVDVPAFEVIDRLPELWGKGRMTHGIASDTASGLKKLLANNPRFSSQKQVDTVADVLGGTAGFLAGVPVGGVAHLMAGNAGNIMNATADAAGRIAQDNAVRKATSRLLPVEDVYGYGNGAVPALVQEAAESDAVPLYQAYRQTIDMPERFANPWVGFYSPSHVYAEPTYNYIEGMTPLQREGVNLGLNPGDPGYVDLDLNRIAAGVNMRRTARRNVEDYIQRLRQARWPRDVSAANRARNTHYEDFLNFNLSPTSRNYRPQTMVQDGSGNYFPEDAGVVAARRDAVTRTGRRQEAIRRSYRERAEDDLRLLQRDLADLQARRAQEISNTGAPSGDVEDAIRDIHGEIADAEWRASANAPTRSVRPASNQPVVSGELATEADIDAFLAEEARNQALDDAIRQDVAEQAYEFTDSAPSANGLLSPVRELSDAKFARRATPRQLRLLSSTPSRDEQLPVIENVMSDVFGSDWRTNPNAFIDSNPIASQSSVSAGTAASQGPHVIGNVFRDRYGISPEEFDRILGPAPGGRTRSLQEYMQTARNLETEAGGIEPLRNMLSQGRLPGQGGAAGAVITPSPSPASPATAQAISQIPGNNEFIEDMFRQNWGMSVDEGADFLRGRGRDIRSMSDISDGFRELEDQLGSKRAVRDMIANAGNAPQAVQGDTEWLRTRITSSHGDVPPWLAWIDASDIDKAVASVSGLNDKELFDTYMSTMRRYIDVPYNHGEAYSRTYNREIENDKLFSALAKEMQKRFGSSQGKIPGYEGETFHFGNLAGTEYDKLARWLRFSDKSPYRTNGLQFALPGDMGDLSWFNQGSGNLNGSGESATTAARRLAATIPSGSALSGVHDMTSIKSEPLKASFALENYGHGPGQMSVEILRDANGRPTMGQRNHFGHQMNKQELRQLMRDAIASRQSNLANGTSTEGLLAVDKAMAPIYEHPDFKYGLVDFNKEFEQYLDGHGLDEYKPLFDNFVSEKIKSARKSALRGLSRQMNKVIAKEGWTDIPVPYFGETDDEIIQRKLRDIARGAGFFYSPQPFSVEHYILKHDQGGFLDNPYAGGGDFETIVQREDFSPSKWKTFLRKIYASDRSDSAVNRYGDFSRMYFGVPLEDGYIYKSNYKPTVSKDQDAVYYGIKDPSFLYDLVELYNHPGAFEKPHTGVVDGYSTKGPKQYPWQGDYISFDLGRELAARNKIKLGKTPHTLGPGALGNFTIGRGEDEKGQYLSYYDIWDVDPRRSKNAEKRGFAKPYEIYDRIYGTFDNDGTFHPEGELSPAVVNGNINSGGGGLSRSKDYKSSKKPYPSVKSGDFAGGGRSYPIPTKADAVDALRLAGLHHRPDVKAKVYAKYPSLKHADGGFLNAFPSGGRFITTLSPEREEAFQRDWQRYALQQGLVMNPDAREHYYDYRGFWNENKGAGQINPFIMYANRHQGHLPDTYKTPGHPTFTVDSIYAKEAPGLAGKYENGVYVPPEKVDQEAIKLRQRYAESAFNDAAKSAAGALGAFQIMPKTAEEYARKMGMQGDLLDSAYNERMRDYIWNEFYNSKLASNGNPLDTVRTAKALAMYNWGQGNLLKYLNKQKDAGKDIYGSLDWINGLPKETRDYINFILLNKDVPDTSKTQTAFEAAAKKFGYALGGRLDTQKVSKAFGMLQKAYGGDIQKMRSAVGYLMKR